MHCFLPVILGALLAPLLAAQEPATALHFKPRDHALGDVHPFFHEGECWLYYLKPGKYEAALARSKHWLRWTETPVTHDAVQAEDWMRPYFVLGVFQDPAAGVFRSFYGHEQGRMASSGSSDLLHWSCAPKEFHVPAADYYQRRRDPYVFWIPEMKQYGCVMTTWMKGRPKETCGAVSLATSPDLTHWQDHGPILDPGNLGEPECPQMFALGGRWYLLASIYDRAVGQPVYWSTNSPLGPWKREPAGVLDGKDLCAAQIAFDGETPVLFGWIPLKPARPGKQQWGGHLALPREVRALPDGRLGTRLPAKLQKQFENLPWQQEAGDWSCFAADLTLMPPKGTEELRFGLASLGEIVLTRDQLRILDAAGECWSELPVSLPEAQPLRMWLVVEDDMVEVFLQDQYSLAARLPVAKKPVKLSLPGGSAVSARFSEWRLRPVRP
ncbi:hypothetical protein [Prosthecobacter sp.]|uniref:hypothetical protein n=1 Tax=Prosthecobacter sp. TaxID=1965333 RepID=UPI00378518E1